MPARRLGVAMLGVAVLCGCAKTSTPAPDNATAAPPTISTPRPPASNEVVVRIRKLGGADGKQVKNQVAVNAVMGEEFNVTEQVGMTQFEFRGTVFALADGRYRVRFRYDETSPLDPMTENADEQTAPKNISSVSSIYELAVGEEVKVSGLTGSKETLVLSLARP